MWGEVVARQGRRSAGNINQMFMWSLVLSEGSLVLSLISLDLQRPKGWFELTKIVMLVMASRKYTSVNQVRSFTWHDVVQ